MQANSTPIDRNKDPILNILKKYLKNKGRLMEIGSGTAEHAVYFANYFKHIEWICSDRKKNLNQITNLLKEVKIKNLHGPYRLEIGSDDFPKGRFDYVLTINTLHIMSWKENKTLFKLLGKRLREGSLVFFYGPFNVNHEYTSSGNQAFDELLKTRGSSSGIRNKEDICSSMEKSGFMLLKDYDMPANNKILVFERLQFQQK